MIVDINRRAGQRRRNICARRPAHWWAWLGCLLAGVALPVATVACVAGLLRIERVGGQAADPRDPHLHGLVTRRLTSPKDADAHAERLAQAAPAVLPVDASMASNVPLQHGARAVTTPPSGQAAPQSAATDHSDGDGDDDGDATARFYLYREVDRPAEPVADWTLDASDLDALATSRLVFTLFVGSDGGIVYCRVDVPERLSPETRRRLADRLRLTPMRPALRAGVAVPSRRRVELYTDGGA